MWHRRKWVIAVVLVAVIILAAGVIGGVAYAQTTTPTEKSTGKTFLGRVAEILGIDQQTLEDAIKQAKKEMQDEALEKRLEALVESGKITQEQADKYREWWESRPDDLPAILDGKGIKGKFREGPGFRCFPGKWQTAPGTDQ